RIVKIIQGLLSFSGNSERDPMVACSIESIVEDTLALCRHRFENDGIRFEADKIPPSLRVLCRPTRISQVLLNLLNNAFDAVGAVDGKWVKLGVEASESYVELSVTDSGPGIPDQDRGLIMQPFFTTKEVGKG